MDYEEEWEFLPDPRFLEFPEDPEQKIFPGKRRSSSSRTVLDMDYFRVRSPESQKIIETSGGNSRQVNKQLVPVPIQLEPAAILKGHEEDDEPKTKEIIKKPVSSFSSAITERFKGSDNIGSIEADQDTVSQVFFKKMKENEFDDMKIWDSPKSPRNIIPQIDQSAMENMNPCSPRRMKNKNSSMDFDSNKEDDIDQVSWAEHNSLALNLWKWSVTGIGAICSFGVAAATVCVIIFGNQQRNKHNQQNQKLRFQIYPDDKRIKQVVQQATKMNEAISAVRGVPITRAHLTYGGYYDSL